MWAMATPQQTNPSSRRPATRSAWSSILAVVAVCLLALPGGVAAAAPAPQGAATAAWTSPGSRSVEVKIEAFTTFYYPSDLDPSRPAPVVIWGNGTGGVPGVYTALLRHWASHGFVVAAANTPASNTGLEMLGGLDRLTRLAADPTSPFHRSVDTRSVVAAGHSQGGAGAIVSGADPRVGSVLALQPGPLADVRGLGDKPLLLLSGTRDPIVPPQLWVLPNFFSRASGPTVYASSVGAGHFAPVLTADGGVFRGITTAWLLDATGLDPRTRAVFHSPEFALAADPAWTDVRRNAAATTW